MRKAAIFAFIFVVLFVVYASLAFSQERVGAKMVLEEKDFNAGNIYEGDIVEHSFKVMNKGTGTLEIISVKPD